MFRNYIQIAFRSILKNKSYVIINTCGLGLALACCITAYSFLAFNLEFDKFHKDDKVSNIFKVHTFVLQKDANPYISIGTPAPMLPIAVEEIAGIKRYTRYAFENGYMRYGEDVFSETIGFADSTFFDMFEFPLISGNKEAFKDLNSIFLSKDMAMKYFGEENPIGELLILNFSNEREIQVVVGGVVDEFPMNSTFVFDALMRMEQFIFVRDFTLNSWGDWKNPSTFVELVDPDNAHQMRSLFDKYIPMRNEAKPDEEVVEFRLEHFKANFNLSDIGYRQIKLRMPWDTVIIVISMAALILLIACFNLTNTSIAMTATRLKEIGIRKAVGAGKNQIVLQFLIETVVSILLTLFVGYLMSRILIPEFYGMWEFPYRLEDLDGLNLFVTLVIMLFIVALLAGIYPALYSSKLNTVLLLKGSIKFKGTNRITRTLISCQFGLSVIVLIGGIASIQNGNYQENIKVGYDKEMIINVSIQDEKEFSLMENRLMTNPKILACAVSENQIGLSTYHKPVKVDNIDYHVRHIGVGKNYFKTMGLDFIQGRPVDPEQTATDWRAIVVNTSFLKKVNIEGDPLNYPVEVHGWKYRIVGVIEDFVDNVQSNEALSPFVIYPTGPKEYTMMMVRVNPIDLEETANYLEATWKELFPTKPYASRFQEDIVLVSKLFNTNLTKMFLFLTILGGVLSASGIYSLASLNVAKRTKEIGIRKALGASIEKIVFLLNKEFLVILIIGGVLGAASGYFLIDALLTLLFPVYHVPISTITLISCGLFVFSIGIITSSFTIFRAARANPVDTLRDE